MNRSECRRGMVFSYKGIFVEVVSKDPVNYWRKNPPPSYIWVTDGALKFPVLLEELEEITNVRSMRQSRTTMDNKNQPRDAR